MIDDSLRELYQEIILDHGKNPRNSYKIDPASHHDKGHNPLCGDTVNVYLDIVDDVISEISVEAKGCAISVASSSIMTEVLQGKNVEQARQLFDYFHHLCMGTILAVDDESLSDDIERLDVMSGVKQYPMRIKCATLAWHTMISSLDSNNSS